jgi:DHA2 family multidrug resistance protein
VTAAPSHEVRRDTVEHGWSLVILTAGVLAATLMQTLDTTIVNVALPVIQGNLGANLDEGAWVVTGYIISAVVVIPLTPWLQLRFGRRQYYATAVVGFTIASVFCGLATSIDSLIIWRVVQGVFGGGLIATAQATLRDIFPKDKLGASQAIFSLGAIVGPSVGPTLGGWLTDNFSWNYVFFINIVPGVFAAFVILTRLKNPTEPRSIPVDGIGLALLACGLGSLQYILDEGQRHDWFDDPLITLCGVAAVVLLGAFALWELFGTDDPVVDLYALRYRAVLAGTVLGLAIGASLFGAIVILPQFLEGSLGYTATLSGYMIFCRALAIAVATPFMARVAAQGKIDTRILLVIGFAMTGISQLWLGAITTTDSDFLTLVAPAIFGGVGLSFVFVPLSIAVLGSLPPHVIPKATAFQSLSFQLGGSLSTAALVTLLARRNAFHQEALAQFASLSHQPFAQMLQEHVPLAQFYGQIIAQATVMSFADAQYALGILTFGLMPLIFVLPRRRRGGPPVPVAMD